MPDAVAQAAGHLDQQFVACVVPQVFIDDFEAIQPKLQQSDAMVEACGVLDGSLAALEQLTAVGQAGEGVKVGQQLDLVLGMTSVGDVLHDAGVANQMGLLVELRLSFQVKDALTTVLQVDLHVLAEHGAVVPDFLQQVLEALAFVDRHHAQNRAQADAVIPAQAENAHAFTRHAQMA